MKFSQWILILSNRIEIICFIKAILSNPKTIVSSLVLNLCQLFVILRYFSHTDNGENAYIGRGHNKKKSERAF